MVLGVVGLKRVLPLSQPLLARLGAEIAAGALIYGATVLLLHRQRTLPYLKMIKEIRRS